MRLLINLKIPQKSDKGKKGVMQICKRKQTVYIYSDSRRYQGSLVLCFFSIFGRVRGERAAEGGKRGGVRPRLFI